MFHRVELRLERLGTKLDAHEKHLASLATRIESHFISVDNHLDGKTGNVVVSLWGATLAMLITAASALTKLL